MFCVSSKGLGVHYVQRIRKESFFCVSVTGLCSVDWQISGRSYVRGLMNIKG